MQPANSISNQCPALPPAVTGSGSTPPEDELLEELDELLDELEDELLDELDELLEDELLDELDELEELELDTPPSRTRIELRVGFSTLVSNSMDKLPSRTVASNGPGSHKAY